MLSLYFLKKLFGKTKVVIINRASREFQILEFCFWEIINPLHIGL